MTPEQFAYWLQGFAEISGQAPNEEQWKIVMDHLALVFDKKTPEYRINTTMPKVGDLPADFMKHFQFSRAIC